MIDEAWRVIREVAMRAGTRDSTVPAGLASLVAVLAVAALIGVADLLARKLRRRAIWRVPTRARGAALARDLVRPAIPRGSEAHRWTGLTALRKHRGRRGPPAV